MEIAIHVRARTPIWTACARPSAFFPYGHWPMWTERPIAETADGPFDRIRPDALLSSMRWWLDAAMRALDAHVCDAPDGARCGACVACQMFASVTLDVTDDATAPIPANIQLARDGWGWNTPPARVGSFIVRLSGERDAVVRLAALLGLLERVGGLGMRLPEGYGAFSIERDGGHLDAVIAASSWPLAVRRRRAGDDALPDLRDIVIARCVIRPRTPGWWTHCAPLTPAALRVQPLVLRGMAPVASAIHAAWDAHMRLPLPERRAVFGALPPHARPARVAVTWAYRDVPDDPDTPWRGPWRVHAAAWTGGLSAAIRERVVGAVADPALWAAALGGDVDVEVGIARLDDADRVVQALRGGALGTP